MTDPALDSLARRAVLFTLPLYEMARTRAAVSPRMHPTEGAAGEDAASRMRWVNDLRHTRQLLGPRHRHVVSPNNDTLYCNAWLDLSEGPVVIDVPDMGERYWTLGFLDMWTNPFAYAGQRTTGNRAQRLFVHGPQWQAAVPQGMIGIRVPGHDCWVIGRIIVDPTDEDLARVHALQTGFRLARPDGMPALRRFDARTDGAEPASPDAAGFRSLVAEALARNPAPAAHAGEVHAAAGFGLVDDRPLAQAQADALARALRDVYRELREAAAPSDQGGGWTIPVTIRTDYGSDFALRARVARNLIGALGIEEAMYIMAEVDSEGRPLDGRHSYLLRFDAGNAPRVDAFWSLTLYRKSDCLLVENPLQRYSIGDRTPGLRHAPDGALEIVMQSADPGPGVSWLPAPAEPFYVALRLYVPRAEHLGLRFAYPPIVRVRADAGS